MTTTSYGSDVPDTGYLIVKTYERMYRETYERMYRGYTGQQIAGYALPRYGVPADGIAKRYRGIGRDPLKPLTQEMLRFGEPWIDTTEPAARLHLYELEQTGVSAEDFILSREGADAVFALLTQPNQRELIWACRHPYAGPRPARSFLLGFEPSWWSGDHFSAVMDSMCFPRWHGHDEEGTALAKFHERLNSHALFGTYLDAEAFCACYSSQEWAEEGPYEIVEVRLVER
jgi:hypothetical protein